MWLLLIAGLVLGAPTGAQTTDATLQPTWYIYNLSMNDTTGELVALKFEVTWGGPAALFIAEYAEGELLSIGWCAFSGSGVYAAASAAGESHESMVIAGESPIVGCGPAISPIGEQQVVVIASGDLRTLRTVLVGEGTLELIAQGPAHAPPAHEIDGVAYAHVNVIDTTARTSVLRTIDFTIDGYLFGWFLTPLGLPGESVGFATLSSSTTLDHCGLNSAEGHPIYLRTKGCAFADFSAPKARGAGSYHLEWTMANAQRGNTPLMAWADIPTSVAPQP